MKRALVTGANGFVGRAVAARLRADGWHVIRAVRAPISGCPAETLVLGMVPWNRDTFASAIATARPDVVFHLAGITSTTDSAELYHTNVVLSASLLDAVATARVRPAVVLMGSAAEYGNLARELLPAREDGPCHPVTDYGISKYAQTLLGLSRARSGLAVLIARLFNSVGVGMPRHLALASFAEQLRLGASELSVGDLDVTRDFIDVAEAARQIVLLASDPGNFGGVFNICSGIETNLRMLVQEMVRLSGRSVRLVIDQDRLRPVDVRSFIGDTSRLRSAGIAARAADFARLLPELLAV
jgi:GDP-4-dehydro-6-deoxy-D-mannose reductase